MEPIERSRPLLFRIDYELAVFRSTTERLGSELTYSCSQKNHNVVFEDLFVRHLTPQENMHRVVGGIFEDKLSSASDWIFAVFKVDNKVFKSAIGQSDSSNVYLFQVEDVLDLGKLREFRPHHFFCLQLFLVFALHYY